MAPPVCGVFTCGRFPSPPTAEVVQVVVEMFNEAVRTGIPSSCNFREFFLKFSCRNLSYSGSSNSSSLPHPSSKPNDSDRSESRDPENPEIESSVGECGSAAVVGVSIARWFTGVAARQAIFSPCNRHFWIQTGTIRRHLEESALTTQRLLEKRVDVCWKT